MSSDWHALTSLTKGRPFTVERVKLDNGVAIEGSFDLPALARLDADDQVFVAAFVRCHGSIKQMEAFFGVSYPTIKNRLNRLSEQIPFPEVQAPPRQSLGGGRGRGRGRPARRPCVSRESRGPTSTGRPSISRRSRPHSLMAARRRSTADRRTSALHTNDRRRCAGYLAGLGICWSAIAA